MLGSEDSEGKGQGLRTNGALMTRAHAFGLLDAGTPGAALRSLVPGRNSSPVTGEQNGRDSPQRFAEFC